MSELLIYSAGEYESGVTVRLEGETVWLSQRQMADLLESSTDNIGLHLKNIYAQAELAEEGTTEDFSVVQTEGRRQVTRTVKHYNLDAIISVGYRVDSRRGVQFRQWATRVLREHLVQGFTLNQSRLAEKGFVEAQQAVELLAFQTRLLEKVTWQLTNLRRYLRRYLRETSIAQRVASLRVCGQTCGRCAGKLAAVVASRATSYAAATPRGVQIMTLTDPSTRIALAAFLHDVGKLAERAGIDHEGRLDAHKTLYCPWHFEGSYHSHVHAAYTGIAWDLLEQTGHFPDLRRDSPPFSFGEDDNATDSAVNAASAHHRPDTFLQWIVATADRVASGFERDKFDSEYNNKKERANHYCARLLTLFEQIGKKSVEEGELAWRYPLKPLSPESLFPQREANCTPRNNADAKAEYHILWDALLEGLKRIPKSHVANLPLWLDHFDSLWLTISSAIPAATAFGIKPEVSLYDHSKAAAGLATALWRWHNEHATQTVAAVRGGWDEPKFLLVQGDFFGIQDFIFAEGGQTQKHAHKLLRGRSFQVALLSECAALKLLDALELPSTSQIINAAGKFLIVAPDTESARAAVARCRKELNAWCLSHTYGEIGVGIATTAASCNDFASGRFGELTKRLFAVLDDAKRWRFQFYSDECSEPPHIHVATADGECKFWLAPVRLARSESVKPAEMRRSEAVVVELRKLFTGEMA